MQHSRSKTSSTSRASSGPATPKASSLAAMASKFRFQSKACRDSKHPTKAILLTRNLTIRPRITPLRTILPRIIHLGITRLRIYLRKTRRHPTGHPKATDKSCRQGTGMVRLKDSRFHRVTTGNSTNQTERLPALGCLRLHEHLGCLGTESVMIRWFIDFHKKRKTRVGFLGINHRCWSDMYEARYAVVPAHR